MVKAEIFSHANGGETFYTSIKNTGGSQREKLEEVIVNLASTLGIKFVYRRESARGSHFYEVQTKDFVGFQSATNTILELSRHLVGKKTSG